MHKNKTKNICLLALLIAVCFAINCDLTNKSTVSENKSSNSEIARTENFAAPNAAVTPAAPINSQTSSANKSANAEKIQKFGNRTKSSFI